MEAVIKAGVAVNDLWLSGTWSCSCNLMEALQVCRLSLSFIIISDSFTPLGKSPDSGRSLPSSVIEICWKYFPLSKQTINSSTQEQAPA